MGKGGRRRAVIQTCRDHLGLFKSALGFIVGFGGFLGALLPSPPAEEGLCCSTGTAAPQQPWSRCRLIEEPLNKDSGWAAAGWGADPKEQLFVVFSVASEANSEFFGVICSWFHTWALPTCAQVRDVPEFYRL